MFLEPRQGEQALSDTESLEEWKSFSAFVSRLVNSGFTELIYLALWELSGALESVPTEQKALMDCQVWAATEWILQCSQLLMKEMMAVEEQTETVLKAPGPLFGKDLPPRSLQRWDFWKKRLAEVSNECETLGIEAETRLRIEKAIEVMESTS